MTDATAQLDGKTVIIDFGENTNVAAAAALRAESAAIAAQAAAGLDEYADTAAGLAGTAEGEFFWVDNAAGIGIIYRHDAGPVATEIRRFIIDPEGTSTASLIGADDGVSGTLWTKVQGFINYLMSSAGSAIVRFIQTGTGATASTVQAELRRHHSVSQRGAVLDGVTNDTTAFTNEFATWPLGLTTVPLGTTLINAPQTLDVSVNGAGLGTVLKAQSTDAVLALGYSNTPSQWKWPKIEDLVIDGNAQTADGLVTRAPTNTEISGRWSIRNMVIQNCRRGFYKPNGNIGNRFYDSNFQGNDFGVYAVGQASPIMHAGNDIFIACHFMTSDLAAYYVDSSIDGTGGTSFRDCIFEANPGFGIFVYNWESSFVPFIMDGVWFEQNHTSTTVTINSVVYTPRDIYLRNTAYARLLNSHVPEIELVNSHLSIEGCTADADSSVYVIDANSVIEASAMSFNGGLHPIIVRSILRASRELGNFTQRFYAAPRSLQSKGPTPGAVIRSATFAHENSVSLTGTATINGDRISDGRIFDSCQEFTIPASHNEFGPGGTLTTNKWYVATFDVKSITGDLSDMTVGIAFDVTMVNFGNTMLKTDDWVTLATVGKCTTGGAVAPYFFNGAVGSQVIRMSAFQIVEFDTEADALAFFNNGMFAMGSEQVREIYGTSAPTTGTWEVGDRIWFTNATAGASPGAICTTAGTPGTWKAMPALAA